MGNNAILSVLGLMVFFGIINTTLNTKNAQSSQNIAAYVVNDAAREIAYDGLSVARLRIDSSFAAVDSFSISGDIGGGSFTVTAIPRSDTIKVQSTGTYQGTSYTVQAGLFHHVKYLPAPLYQSAIHLQATPAWLFWQSSASPIDGRDHDTSGALTATRTSDGFDVTVFSASDSVNINNRSSQYWYFDWNRNSSGSSAKISLRIKVDPTVTPSSYVDTLAANADYVYRTTGTTPLHLPSTNWGSKNNPVIVYVDAGSYSYAMFDSQYVGWGVLVVRGNAWLPGNVRWNGLVISYTSTGSSNQFTLDGTSEILGSLVFVGNPSSELDLESSAKILYSSSTLQIIQNMAKLNKYIVNNVSQWYE